MVDLEILPLFCVGPLRIGSDTRAVHDVLGACEHRADRIADGGCLTDFWLGGRFQVHYAGEARRVALIEVSLDPRVVPRLFGMPLFARKASHLMRQLASYASVPMDIREGGIQCICASLELALGRTGADDSYFSTVAVGGWGHFSGRAQTQGR
ncbi:hypothetical protein WKW79_35355 [Variovorax robiniae]|uniref:Uncharacterized protein n=1 Tax=Variovorax robiniae TaxID=1836199 RepID=A0ABU8XJ15_9BURK